VGKLAYIAIIVLVIALAAGVFMAFYPTGRPPAGKPALIYSVGGCSSMSYDGLTRGYGSTSRIELTTGPSSINMIHHLSYVCCADIVVSLEPVEHRGDHILLKIVERNVGEMCRCICEYEITIKIADLEPGRYKIELYGVQYEDIPAEKFWEGSIEL